MRWYEFVHEESYKYSTEVEELEFFHCIFKTKLDFLDGLKSEVIKMVSCGDEDDYLPFPDEVLSLLKKKGVTVR